MRSAGKTIKRASLAFATALLGAAFLASPAHAAFGIAAFDGQVSSNQAGDPYTQAGGHPFAVSTTIEFNKTIDSEGLPIPDENPKQIRVDAPPGFLGNPLSAPTQCTAAQLNYGEVLSTGKCPESSQVGTVAVEFSIFGGGFPLFAPLYNMEPAAGEPARLGFRLLTTTVYIDTELNTEGEDHLRFALNDISEGLTFFESKLTFWGVPADSGHDGERGSCLFLFGPTGESCPVDIPHTPLITLPTFCPPAGVGFAAFLHTEAWPPIPGTPGSTDDGSFISHLPPAFPEPPANWGPPQGTTGCEKEPFEPTIDGAPTSDQAETASGLEFDVNMPDNGLLNPSGITESQIRKAEVSLPAGVTLNPSSAEGLGTCSPAQLAAEMLRSQPGAGCPNQSKIGSVDIESPLIHEHVTGSMFLATPNENPFNSLIAIYVVARSVDRGIIVKLAGKVEPDAKTGQIVTTFDDLPQVPFSNFHLHFREGGRAPLVTPPACGTYQVVGRLTPWSAANPANPSPDELVTTTSDFQVTKGVGAGPCPPAGVAPFHPAFQAGSLNNNAKSYSPFYMRLIRADGEQDMTKFSSILPPGVLGKLAGVSKCPDAAIAAAGTKTGRQELASPSCPANSKIGHVLVGAGVGSVLTYVPGQIYLGGPYKGDPLSVVVITPAVAGPFDAGTVVVREALTLNPDTAEVEVDGANSDPIPHILKGIPLKVRDLRVYVDRPEFILNPTSCAPSSAKATLFGSFVDVFSPADDVPVGLAARYQAANCANLGFKPRLSLHLKGGTKRGSHPALHAVLNANAADANIGSAVVTLPRSAFLDQAHIRTICTRVQFAAKACPPGAQYGYATAYTPLLDEPVQGPVYLRSSNHKLPDLVAALHGIVDVNIVGRIDSFHGGIRSSFETVPDAPVSKFVLDMQGGRKGLIVNSRDLCARQSRATAHFVGQNGKPDDFNPLMQASCGKQPKSSQHRIRR